MAEHFQQAAVAVPEPGKEQVQAAEQAAGQKGPGKSPQDPLEADPDMAEQFPVLQHVEQGAPDPSRRGQDVAAPEALGSGIVPQEKDRQEGQAKMQFTLHGSHGPG